MMTDDATDSSLKRVRVGVESSPDRRCAESAHASSRPRLDQTSDETTMNTNTSESGAATFARLASVEVQLIMQMLGQTSLLRLARCSRQTLADADHPAAWNAQGTPALGRHASYDIPQRLSGLMRNRSVLVRWTFTSRATEAEEIAAFEKLGTIRNLVRLEVDGGQNVRPELWPTHFLARDIMGRLEYLKVYGCRFDLNFLPALARVTPHLRELEVGVPSSSPAPLEAPTAEVDASDASRVVVPWPHLTTLTIVAPQSGLAADFFPRLAQAAPALHTFTADQRTPMKLACLSSLPCLTSLRLLQGVVPDFASISECRGLREIRTAPTDRRDPDGFFPPLPSALHRGPHMRTVERLTLVDVVTPEDVSTYAELFGNMVALADLTLFECNRTLLTHVHRIGPTLRQVHVMPLTLRDNEEEEDEDEENGEDGRLRAAITAAVGPNANSWLSVDDLRQMLRHCGPEVRITIQRGSSDELDATIDEVLSELDDNRIRLA